MSKTKGIGFLFLLAIIEIIIFSTIICFLKDKIGLFEYRAMIVIGSLIIVRRILSHI